MLLLLKMRLGTTLDIFGAYCCILSGTSEVRMQKELFWKL
jgi:hypothetical protein